MALYVPPGKKIEFLIGTSEFHVRFYFHGIISLKQRIEKFQKGDALSRFNTFLEIGSAKNLLKRACRGEPHKFVDSLLNKPIAVVHHLCLSYIQNFSRLGEIAFHILFDFVRGKWLTRFGATARIPDTSGKITYDKNHLMFKFLKFA